MRLAARWSISIDMVRLINDLERFGRNFVALPMDQDRLKLVVKAKQLAKCQRLFDDQLLPLELRQRAAEVVGDAERVYQERASQLGRAYSLQIAGIEKDGPNPTRHLSKLDSYVQLLAGVWVNLCGDWWSRGLNTAEARAFIAACAAPVVGEKSASVDAIGKRLQRLIRRRDLAVWITFKMPDGRLEQIPITLWRTRR